jgi:3-oxoacyl-[acyl-carrier protein] reductase
MNLALRAKRVLVTGSSRGIGLAIARAFAEEEARVLLAARTKDTLDAARESLKKEFPQQQILSAVCDFTSRPRVHALSERVRREWNGLDVLICNVGSGKSVPDAVPPAPHFDRVFALNFDSAVNATRAFYALLRENKGTILFISSIAGIEAFGAPVDYSTAKTALLAFAKNMARKSAADGIRVNAVAPGNIFFEGGTWDRKVKADPESVERLIHATVPMRKFGTLRDVADAALFLCSDRAAFITGACLVVDGGQAVTLF